MQQRPSSLSDVHPMAAGSRHYKSRKGGTSKINPRPRQAELQYQPGIPSFSPGGGSQQRLGAHRTYSAELQHPDSGCCCCPSRIAHLLDKAPKTEAAVESLFSHAQLCFR